MADGEPADEADLSRDAMIDFSTTTVDLTGRDALLESTYESFADNLRGVDLGKCTLYMNVDTYHGKADPERVAKAFFGNVVVRRPESPSFAGAVKWCFAQGESKLRFHLEDDWILTRPVEISEMLDLMVNETQGVNLMAYERFRMGNTRCYLSPGLWYTKFLNRVAMAMNTDENPEHQLWRITDRQRAGYYWPSKQVITDIGREWLESKGVKKDKGTYFTKWEAA